MSLLERLNELADRNVIRPIDVHFTRLLVSRARQQPEAVALAAIALTQALERGDMCCHLSTLRAQLPLPFWPEQVDHHWLISALHEEVEICGRPDGDAVTPLVLDQQRLYLRRYFEHERLIAKRIWEASTKGIEVDEHALDDAHRLFANSDTQSKEQQNACVNALKHHFSVISGGPGTGKTTTVARLLVLLQRRARRQGRSLLIRLAAPTGKAAARVRESITSQLSQLKQNGLIDDEMQSSIPDDAQTLHRLLGSTAQGRFRHDRANPLAVDVLVIDESSMMDATLFAAVVDALPAQAQLILLGDRNQLAAVEAGNVFAEICDLSNADSPRVFLQSAVARACSQLNFSHRFAGVPAIGDLADAVNAGDGERLASQLSAPAAGVTVTRYSGQPDSVQLDQLIAGYRPLIESLKADAADPVVALQLQSRFQVLCALREGPTGVVGLNKRMEQRLQALGWLSTSDDFYLGRPIMINRNDHAQRLFNGDLGLVMQLGDERMAVFPGDEGQPRRVPVRRLPGHETAWSMTVHKSQGSEFDHIALVLPVSSAQSESLLRRELLYTAITRARERVSFLLPEGPIPNGWLQRTERHSGLAERLRVLG